MLWLFLLSVFLGFLATVLLLLGIINPKVGLFWFRGLRTRRKVLLFYGIGLFFSLVAMGVLTGAMINGKADAPVEVAYDPTEDPLQVTVDDILFLSKAKTTDTIAKFLNRNKGFVLDPLSMAGPPLKMTRTIGIDSVHEEMTFNNRLLFGSYITQDEGTWKRLMEDIKQRGYRTFGKPIKSEEGETIMYIGPDGEVFGFNRTKTKTAFFGITFQNTDTMLEDSFSTMPPEEYMKMVTDSLHLE